jgi:hypothetical protein
VGACQGNERDGTLEPFGEFNRVARVPAAKHSACPSSHRKQAVFVATESASLVNRRVRYHRVAAAAHLLRIRLFGPASQSPARTRLAMIAVDRQDRPRPVHGPEI